MAATILILMDFLSKPQPNLNLTLTQRLSFTRKLLYNQHHHPPPQKLNVSNISAVSDPILMKLKSKIPGNIENRFKLSQ